MSKQMMAIVAVVVLVLLGGAFFVMNQNNTAPAPAPSDQTITPPTPEVSSNPAASSAATESTGAVKEFTVSSTGFVFTPATLSVNKGDTVKLTYKNGGGTHNWTLDEFNTATKTINSGQSETVTFVADQVGSFEYYCSVSNHRQMGMKGTLTVK